MSAPQTTKDPLSAAMQGDYAALEARLKTLLRVTTSKSANVAQTPKRTIWTLNKAKLYRYTPVVPPEQRHPIPLLLVFAIMNRPYVLDLRPGNSFVEYMVQRGYDVYLIDWGSPGPDDVNIKFDDYALEYLPRAVRKMKAVSGASEFSILGWCLGALISTLYASLRPDDGLRNLILLTAPLDFTDKTAGGFLRQVNDQGFDPAKLTAAFGNMPGELIDYGAKALKPVENYVGNYLTLWDNLGDPRIVESWHAMNTWVSDLIPMAGGAFRQLISEFYRDNALVAGTLRLRGEPVSLGNLRANLLNLIALADHITPPCQSEGIMDMFGTEDKTLLKVPGGHIGMMAGSGAQKRVWPQIDEWLAARSNAERGARNAE
jgi:polyhydroxyalkanoate synthase